MEYGILYNDWFGERGLQRPEEDLVEGKNGKGNIKKVIFYNLRMSFVQSNIQNDRLSIFNSKGLDLLCIINFLRTKIFTNLPISMKCNYIHLVGDGVIGDICYSNLDYVAGED